MPDERVILAAVAIVIVLLLLLICSLATYAIWISATN